MGKGARIRRDKASRAVAKELAKAAGGVADPKIAAVEAKGEEGKQFAIKQLIESARSQGCTCVNPNVRVTKSGSVGHLMLQHAAVCPFYRSLQETDRR
jgi:hypothetical protein